MRLALDGDGYLPGAVMDVFRVVQQMPPDAKTRDLLSVIANNRELIKRGGPSFMPDRLKGLLSEGFDPQLIAKSIQALLTAAGSAVGDIRTEWAADARDLIEVSITLQRFEETRGIGLDLFEGLMDVGAYDFAVRFSNARDHARAARIAR